MSQMAALNISFLNKAKTCLSIPTDEDDLNKISYNLFFPDFQESMNNYSVFNEIGSKPSSFDDKSFEGGDNTSKLD